ncbi:MAG: undecaprenyldiphospho-muramoylpentapeptide beta-N-acetylglucosaminyltransferase, partial [Planctomycetes bacterium]|nr:undecaprenyldiphospho-muramoylpentapeptide beta-N-acetylglucosaminyltransferase [Planctomycetota bacterium]
GPAPQPACARSHAKRLRIAFAGGGTGGHLMPGVTVARAVAERMPEAEIVFFGTQGGLEQRIVAQHGFRLEQIKTEKRKSGWRRLPMFALRSIGSLIRAHFAVGRFEPDVIVGLGGFGCVFPALSGILRGAPIVLLEQNVLPGRANRLLSRWARSIECQWEESAAYLKKGAPVRHSGNPVRDEIFPGRREARYDFFGLSPNKKTLLVTGGSQGALSVNELFVGALKRYEEMADRIQVVHCAGEVSVDRVKSAYASSSVVNHVCSYLEDMAAAYAIADLVIARAGGTTIAELTAAGMPAILIPLPTAADDHQRLNAEVMTAHGAAITAHQGDLTPDKLFEIVRDLLSDEKRLGEMRRNALAMGKPDATKDIAERICKIALGEVEDK